MKEEKGIPKFYTNFIIFIAIIIVATLIFLFIEKKFSRYYYVIIVEGLIFLIVMISAIYSYYKMKLLVHDDMLEFYSNTKKIEIKMSDIKEFRIESQDKIWLNVKGEDHKLPHSIIDSSGLFKLLFDNLSDKRPDLLTEDIKKQYNQIYKNSLCFDQFTYIIDRVGFFAMAMSIISFYVTMYLIVDYHSIKLLGQIALLIYALAWPFLTGLILFLRFASILKESWIENTSPEIVKEFFHTFPYSLIFSTFAELFIILAVLKYFT